VYIFRSALLALCATAPLSASLAAQNGATGHLSGQIVDSGNATVTGARIDARQLDGSSVFHLSSDQEGRFVLPLVPIGQYQIHVTHDGFRDLEQTVTISASSSALTLVLEVASFTQNVTVEAQPLLITETPTGQTQAEVSRGEFKNSPATTIGDVLGLVPGITYVQGNGPRDIRLSVRGANDRQSFGVRNVQIFEDGFPVTQPDGQGRTDLTDPHAYSSIDVIEGPSSALYGNYATGGAINFHTRSGSEIQGLEVGSDFGSFGYYNDYASYGAGNKTYQISGFLSNVRADQATANNQFNTITANLLATVAPTPRDRLTFKFIDNDLSTKLSLRLSLNQYRLNPYQQSCETYSASAVANGCGTANLYLNGFNGAKVAVTAAQAGFSRHDRRTIVGARWEHDLTPSTTWRTQFVFDDRDIGQPTSAYSYRGPYSSFNLISDLLQRNHGWTSYAGAFFNYENINSYVFNVMPGGQATLGGQTQTVFGSQLNTGFRAREERVLAPKWTMVAGLGGEVTSLQAVATNYTYPTTGSPTLTPIIADRAYFNLAPELSVRYQPTEAWSLHARFGTGYGTPQATQLFVTPQGTNGNNTQLKTQTNEGIDVGTDLVLSDKLQITFAGFYEWFHNEQVTQSAGVNLQSYTFNAPASQHRGVDLAINWRPLPHTLSGARIRASYQYDNQIYTAYTETLTAGTVSASFSRDQNRIPGVQPNFLNARVLYDQPSGRLSGLGAFLETNWRDNYQLDNANLLKSPGYTLLNLDTHYEVSAGHGEWSQLRFYFDIQNLANKTYVGSAINITDSLAAGGQENGASTLSNTTGSVYAGGPRASYGGVRVRF
jgi:iron complex outermembrane receptor protein